MPPFDPLKHLLVVCRCGQRFQAPVRLAGTVVSCPGCHQPLQVVQTAVPVVGQMQIPAPQRNDSIWDEVLPRPKPPPGYDPYFAQFGRLPDQAPEPEKMSHTQLVSFAIEQHAKGVSSRAIIEQIVATGASRSEAERIAATIDEGARLRKQNMAVDESHPGMQIFGGVALLGMGVGITLVTYYFAAPGGTFVIAIGPMVWGVYMIVMGMIRGLVS